MVELESVLKYRPSPTRQRLDHVPPLSILHLLFFTTVAAALSSAPAELELGTASPSLPVAVASIVWKTIISAQITGLFILVWHTARRTLWLLEPGEWLIVAGGTANLIGTFYMIIVQPLSPAGPLHAHSTILAVANIAFPVAQAAAFASVAFGARRDRWWAALLSAGAGTPMLNALIQIAFVTGHAGYILSLHPTKIQFGILILATLLLAIVVISDRRKASRRHWLHWLGVTSFGCITLASIIVNLLYF